MRTALTARLGLVVAAVGLGACQAPPVKPTLSSDRTAEKVPALIEQVRQGEEADFPALVASLDAPDPAVRLYAIRALEELTGQTHDYRYYQQSPDRRPAVNRWKDWLAQRGGDGPLNLDPAAAPDTDLADGSPADDSVPGLAPGVSP